MTKRQLRLLGVGIILLGVALAMPFRRMASGLPETKSDAEPDLELQQVQSKPPVHPVPASSAMATEMEPAEPAMLPPQMTSSAGNRAASSSNVPAMADEYQPAMRPMILRRPVPREQKPRPHKLVDGDSLPGLASRYLGNARRYVEILQANPGLNPNLLPLGKVITIPPKIRPPSPRANNAETKLVPIGG